MPYEQARREYDDKVGVGNYPYGEQTEDRQQYGRDEGGESRFGGGHGGREGRGDYGDRGQGREERGYGDRDEVRGDRGYGGDREERFGGGRRDDDRREGGYGGGFDEGRRRDDFGGDNINLRGGWDRDPGREQGYGGRQQGYGDREEEGRDYGDQRGDREGYGGGYGENRGDPGERREEGERYGGREYEDNNRRQERRDDSERYGRDDGSNDRRQSGRSEGRTQGGSYEQYQQAAATTSDDTRDSVAACYMHTNLKINDVQWQGSPESELDAFVSEELYIHTKVLIADDKLVICGSANLNDRSQLGTHDSEIAVIIEDKETVESTMNGQQFQASKFATSLRRQLFRKHLGLLPHQPVDGVNANWTPITQDPQQYDWGSQTDRLVEDPMSSEFWDLWSSTARTNTEVFNKVFHPVPTDLVHNWDEYKEFFSRHFIIPGVETKEEDKQGKVDYGHVVRSEFPGGVGEVKEWLGRIRGTLVDMPLEFLIDVHDLAKEGLSLNAFTDEIYT